MPIDALPVSADGPRGRGAASNPKNRFERLDVEPEEPRADRVETVYLTDTTRSIVAHNDSPDVGFSVSLNPYRGCEHGCSYCYARPYHEYLGFSAGLDFETKILVKEDAPELLRAALASPRWQPQVLGLSGVTDAYQPVERRLEITRRCLAVLAEARNPVVIVTKNHLVTRDVDHLGELASHGAAAVAVSVTTLDPELSRRMEPRASAPRRRLEAIATLAAAGIPVRVNAAPMIPGLTDHELPAILAAAAEAGATLASYILVRLPYGVKDLFTTWLETHAPGRKDKVLHRLHELRGGKLNDPRFGHRMRGEGVFADELRALFDLACRKHGLKRQGPELSTAAFRRPRMPDDRQMALFG